MNDAIENLKSAFERGMAGRPKVGGFPYLAEALREAGVTRNLWSLPSCQSLYLTDKGPVVMQGIPRATAARISESSCAYTRGCPGTTR